MDIFDTKGIKPMLISERVDPYNDPDSIFELKLDGIRCIAYCNHKSTDLRNKRDVKLLPHYPELESLYKGCKDKCILDGELIVLVNGKPDFHQVQRRSLMTDTFKMKLAASKYPASFVAYDIIYYKGRLVNDLPLMERKQILQDVVSENNLLSYSRYVDTYGKQLYDLAVQEKLEGVVGKKKDSHYWFDKRTKDWNKIKWMKDDDVICIGYIVKPNHMTSLVMAKFDSLRKFNVVTHVTLGGGIRKLREYGIEESDCPLEHIPEGHENAIWIKPIVCAIEYMPLNRKGYRQTKLKAIRNDKNIYDCRY